MQVSFVWDALPSRLMKINTLPWPLWPSYRANICWLAVANAVVGVVPCILSIDVASMARAADLSALDRHVHSTIVQILGLTDPMCNIIVCHLVQLAEYFAIDYLDSLKQDRLETDKSVAFAFQAFRRFP